MSRAAPYAGEVIAALPAVRTLARLVRRRFGVGLGFVEAEGRSLIVCATDGDTAALCASPTREGPSAKPCLAVGAARSTSGHPPVVRCHTGRYEIAVPVRKDQRLIGHLVAGGFATPTDDHAEVVEPATPQLGAEDLEDLRDLLELGAAHVGSSELPRERVETATRKGRTYDTIIGESDAMQELSRLLDKVTESDTTVLLQGENGTGKELVARAIHDHSARRNDRFVAQNCSAFNDNLLDSELFGHKRGAFTGAIGDKAGLFEVADRGSFFLDEIGDMSAALQVKLLRVLQEGTFTPVGSTTPRHVDVRVIAATNRDLKKMIARGTFREDLYYRINVITLTLPPLRDRVEDLPGLVAHFLAKHGKGRGKRLTKACLERFRRYPWPGNIRELENEIERLIVLSGDAALIDTDLLSPRMKDASPADGGLTANPRALPDAVERLECKMIYDALKKTRWNKSKAASELRISRRNLIRKVSKYKLDDRKPRM